jgi:hypothetical protein
MFVLGLFFGSFFMIMRRYLCCFSKIGPVNGDCSCGTGPLVTRINELSCPSRPRRQPGTTLTAATHMRRGWSRTASSTQSRAATTSSPFPPPSLGAAHRTGRPNIDGFPLLKCMRRCECQRGELGMGSRRGVRRRMRVRTLVWEHADVVRRCGMAARRTSHAEGVGGFTPSRMKTREGVGKKPSKYAV